MAKQKFPPTRLVVFSGAKAYIEHVEVLKKCRNAKGGLFVMPSPLHSAHLWYTRQQFDCLSKTGAPQPKQIIKQYFDFLALLVNAPPKASKVRILASGLKARPTSEQSVRGRHPWLTDPVKP